METQPTELINKIDEINTIDQLEIKDGNIITENIIEDIIEDIKYGSPDKEKQKKNSKQKKEKNVNFSVYYEKSQTVKPVKLISNNIVETSLPTIYPKQNKIWVDGKLVPNCQRCNVLFTMWNRQHHCRSCGCVYCVDCCNKYIEIPTDLIDIPTEDFHISLNVVKSQINNDTKSLVCTDCYDKIDQLTKSNKKSVHCTCNKCDMSMCKCVSCCEDTKSRKKSLISRPCIKTSCFQDNGFQQLNFMHIAKFQDIETLYITANVCKNWRIASIYYLSKFRNIQYAPINATYGEWERNILWSIKDTVINHNEWLTALVKSVIQNYLLSNCSDHILNLMTILGKDTHKENNTVNPKECWTLMCSRRCDIYFDTTDFINIIENISLNKNNYKMFWNDRIIHELLGFLLNKRRNVHDNMKFLIPYLTKCFRNMMDIEFESINLDFYFLLLDRLFDKNENNLFQFQMELDYMTSPDIKPDKMRGPYNFIEATTKYLKKTLGYTLIDEKERMVRNFKLILKKMDPKIIVLPMLYPFDATYKITKINEIMELSTKTRPLRVDAEIEKNNITKNIQFLIKKDRSVRKEQIVACLIKMLQSKLIYQSQRGNLETFDPVPTYDIMVISDDIGIIEFVRDSKTLERIAKEGYSSLINYVLEHNEREMPKLIKDRIFKSLAISSCMAYILGLRDRNMGNILMNKQGQIFHIDYEYIMESPKTNVFGEPVIKVTREMIEILGGEQSQYYAKFKEYIINVFDILRLYKQTVFSYYNILESESFITTGDFCKKLDARFMTGMSCKGAGIVLINEIENYTARYTGALVDACHHYKSAVSETLTNLDYKSVADKLPNIFSGLGYFTKKEDDKKIKKK